MALDSGKVLSLTIGYWLLPTIIYFGVYFSYYNGNGEPEGLWAPSLIAGLLFLFMAALGLTAGKEYATK